MNLPLYIAGRYLFSRKSHNVINVISAISVAGMAIGTAALILILSVYNGFDGIIRSNLSDLNPDYKVVSASSKTFVPGSVFDTLRTDSRVQSWCNALEEHVFVTYGEPQKQAIARARGLEFSDQSAYALGQHIVDGEFTMWRGDIPLASLGAGLANTLKARPRFLDKLYIWYPERTGSISIANPMASVNSATAMPGSIFSISSDVDADLMVLPMEVMREVLDSKDELTSVEFWLKPGQDGTFIKEAVGDGFIVQDRYMQNPAIYKMMRYEKAAVFMILFFVVMIVALNIFGSMSMLIIEKKNDISTLRAMGANDALIKKVFVLEGWLISLLGLVIGTVIGILLALLQQKFGIVKMPGNFLINAYPVVLQAADVLLTCGGVALIGLAVALLSAGSWSSEKSSPRPEE